MTWTECDHMLHVLGALLGALVVLGIAATYGVVTVADVIRPHGRRRNRQRS